MARASSSAAIRAGLAMRARIVLLASDGVANARIAAEVGTTTTSVWKWRNRYAEAGLPGLVDASRSGRPKHVDDERIITATLFAALEIATGHVTGAVKPKHRRQEFLALLRRLDRAHPKQDLHLVMDNYATHKTPEVKAGLETHPPSTLNDSDDLLGMNHVHRAACRASFWGCPVLVDIGDAASGAAVVIRSSKAIGLIWPRALWRRRQLSTVSIQMLTA